MTDHPCPYSEPIIPVMVQAAMRNFPCPPSIGVRVWIDPFAGKNGVRLLKEGVGKIQLPQGRLRVVAGIHVPIILGVELEPEWANEGLNTACGDAATIRFDEVLAKATPGVTLWQRSVTPGNAVIVTSPAYGGRMCLAPGSMVTTWEGPTPIEDVQVGTLVLTHRGRWRRVTWAGSRGTKEVVTVSGQGATLTCTPDHRFWSARRGDNGVHSVGWREAAELRHRSDVGPRSAYKYHYWATPSAIEPCELPECPRGAEAWWIIGFWLGNGSVGNNSTSGKPSTVHFSKDMVHADTVQSHFDAVGAVRDEQRGTKTMAVWALYDGAFAQWLPMTFGRSAYTKTLPGWVHGLDRDEREALLEGWLAADGSERNDAGRASNTGVSASSKLIRGMQVLAASVGRSTGYSSREAFTGSIMGSTCDFVAAHRLDVHHGISRKAHPHDGSIWYAVRSVEPAGSSEVYDLEVEEDHSFVANGISVHNSDQYLGTPEEQRVRAETGKLPRRRSYAISLGRRLSTGSGAALQWGKNYRDMHLNVMLNWADWGVGGAVINISDHFRDGVLQPVSSWWIEAMTHLAGFELIEARSIATRRFKDGANRDARAEHECVLVFKR